MPRDRCRGADNVSSMEYAFIENGTAKPRFYRTRNSNVLQLQYIKWYVLPRHGHLFDFQ